MKPVTIVQAYACSCCGKVFEMKPLRWMTQLTKDAVGFSKEEVKKYRARMKAFAAACCTCPSCHKKCDRYHGTSDKYCSACKRAKECEQAASELEIALKRYQGVAHRHSWRDPGVEADLATHVATKPMEGRAQ